MEALSGVCATSSGEKMSSNDAKSEVRHTPTGYLTGTENTRDDSGGVSERDRCRSVTYGAQVRNEHGEGNALASDHRPPIMPLRTRLLTFRRGRLNYRNNLT